MKWLLVSLLTSLFFVKIDKIILKLIQKLKGLRIAKTFLEKSMVVIFTIPNFKTPCKVTVIKAV